MSSFSASNAQQERGRRHEESRRVRITNRPPRREATHQVYTRLPGSIPSNYYDGPSAPFVWEYSDGSSSAHGQGPSSALSQKQTNDRIEEWMERMKINDLVIRDEKIKDTTCVAPGANPLVAEGVDPNIVAPSVVGSHYSGESLPSRPASPVLPPPISERPPGQQPVVIRPLGYVPPERRVERERANRVIVSDDLERRRRRREERDKGQRRRC